MSGVLCVREVAGGALSRPFSADELLDALRDEHQEQVAVFVDEGGCLSARGGAARAAVSARLAPHECARDVLLLELAPGAGGAAGGGPPRLRLRAAAALPARREARVWFEAGARAALQLPHLAPRHIRGDAHYACACGARFADPNPLKAHLLLACRPVEPRAFWREIARRLRDLAPRPERAPRPTRAPSPARLEALATEWGRSRDGHRCVYCGKLYSRRYGLKIHLRTHTGYRPLRCAHCARAFGDPSNLNKHVRLHAAARRTARYPCGACGRALARRRDLERHVRAQHGTTLPEVADPSPPTPSPSPERASPEPTGPR